MPDFPWSRLAVGAGGAATVAVASMAVRNLTYELSDRRRIDRAGMVESRVTDPAGGLIAYGEGPPGGTPLLLIHGQMSSWWDYAPVLGALTRDFHVFAVDCFGHGGSAKEPHRYPARAQVDSLSWFIDEVIGAPAVVSGHSSGGLLASLLAARSPHLVAGLLIEDAPFFATEPDRAPATYAWLDGFRPMNDYLSIPPSQRTRWTRYWLDHNYLRTLWGDGWEPMVARPARRQMDRDPMRIPRLWWLGISMNRAFDLTACLQDGTGDYDLRFGRMFYDGSWFDGFDQQETLATIAVPTTLVHTRVRHTADGVLLGAATNADAQRAHQLIDGSRLVDDVRTGHDVKRDKPTLVVDLLRELRPVRNGVSRSVRSTPPAS